MEVISYAVHVLLNVAKVFPTSGTEGAALAGTRGSAIRCIFTYHWTPDPKWKFLHVLQEAQGEKMFNLLTSLFLETLFFMSLFLLSL